MARATRCESNFEPVQPPWLADEIDTLRSCIEDELARARAARDQVVAGAADGRSPGADDAEGEVARREYQLQVLRGVPRFGRGAEGVRDPRGSDTESRATE